jgi:hypothetical protein
MNVAETIQEKIGHLPARDQQEVLRMVEQLEARIERRTGQEGPDDSGRGLLDLLSDIRIQGPADLSERHDFYAHGKLEE